MKTRTGTAADDIIDGTDVDEKIYGLAGNDRITGGGGNDRIWCGENGAVGPGLGDFVDGGNGNDLIYGEGGIDNLKGGKGDDRIFGGDGDDFLFGFVGNDKLSGDAGNDMLIGEKGKDTLKGGAGNDTLDAIMGNDLMDGGTGDDIYFTGQDKAQTTDKSGNDTYYLEIGNPSLSKSGDAAPHIFDRTGNDTLIFRFVTADQLTFVREGYDLQIEVKGFGGEAVISDFFVSKNHQIETLMDDPDDDEGYDLSDLSSKLGNGERITATDLWDL